MEYEDRFIKKVHIFLPMITIDPVCRCSHEITRKNLGLPTRKTAYPTWYFQIPTTHISRILQKFSEKENRNQCYVDRHVYLSRCQPQARLAGLRYSDKNDNIRFVTIKVESSVPLRMSKLTLLTCFVFYVNSVTGRKYLHVIVGFDFSNVEVPF